ncbi:alpha/beta fold hydrolase [Streptomyces sp. 1222.5]|uniref:alpha/beta fold hydrolase n=1 Tax=Streptomyces sp. 1222.5 TaxID=1881026 RepID=UPI003EB7644E
MSCSERFAERDGVALACRDRPKDGSPVVPLHGPAGHAGEWDGLARVLSPGHRVVAVDQRGPGASEHPQEVSRAACVAYVMAVVEQLGLRRPVPAGRSPGGHTAVLAAAAHPLLVHCVAHLCSPFGEGGAGGEGLGRARRSAALKRVSTRPTCLSGQRRPVITDSPMTGRV